MNDAIVHEVCIMAMKSVDRSKWSGVILDGYPRTTAQAKLLDDYVSNTGTDTFQLSIAVNIILEKWAAVDKLLGIFFMLIYLPMYSYLLASGRVHCDKCNTGYNTCNILTKGYLMPAILPSTKTCVEMKLDPSLTECSQPFVRRNDDTKDTISKRLDEYYEKTEPVLAYYRNNTGSSTRLKEFQVKKGIDDLDALIECMLR